MSFQGLSAYITSQTGLETALAAMRRTGMNIIRYASRPSFLGSGREFNANFVDYILSNTNYTVVLDVTHLYPPETAAAQLKANWTAVVQYVENIFRSFEGNPRVFGEPFNEYDDPDYYTVANNMVSTLRAVTNAQLVFNHRGKTQPVWQKIQDPLELTWHGYHYYMNYWSPDGVMNDLAKANTAGIPYDRILNTEVGADSNESTAFTAATVAELSEVLRRCSELGASNTIWQRQNADNMPKYESLGLVIPLPIPPEDKFYVNVSTDGNGIASLMGYYEFTVGQTVSILTTPNANFKDGGYTINGVQGNSYPIVFSGSSGVNYTVAIAFVPIITPPPPKPSNVGMVPYFGQKVYPSTFIQVYMRQLRDKVISKKLHKRLHPIV